MDDDKKAMSRDHRHINLQMFTSVMFMVGYFYLGLRLIPRVAVETLDDRLAYALRWEVLIAVVVLLAIFNVGMRRYFAPKAERDGIDTEGLRLPLAFLSNTLEQGFCCFIFYLALALTIPSEMLTLIPLLCVLFVIGRLCFYYGYHYQAVWRAFGFGMTMLPCAGSAFYLLYRLL